jgi:hypothetical protein
MRTFLVALALVAGCGGAAPRTNAPDATGAPPSALDGQLAGAWIVVSDSGVVPQGCASAMPMDTQRGCAWRDVWNFAAGGAWVRDVEGGHYSGAWTTTDGDLGITAVDSAMTGPYGFADCGRAARCLQFAPGWGTLILSR